MSLKYVEIELEDLPEYTPEEFKNLSAERKHEVMMTTLMNLHKRTFLMAAGFLKYGMHTEDCTTDPDECTCGFTDIGDMAIGLMETIAPLLKPKDYKVN